MKPLSLYLCLIVFSNIIYGQPYVHKLKQGDKVPDVIFSILKNDKFEVSRLSDFTGKLVILDYWNIWCKSCIEAFPKLELLQKKYPDDLVILPVSFINSKSAVRDFVNRRRGTENEVKFPLAIFENINNPLFQVLPTIGYPHEVWIGPDGKVLLISEASEVTEDNILLILKGKTVNVQFKNFQMNFDSSKPLLTNNNGGPDTAFTYRSLITKRIDSVSSYSYNYTVSNNHIHLFYGNNTLIELLKRSLKEGISDDFYNQYVVFDSPSAKAEIFPSFQETRIKHWRIVNSYCYDLVLPPSYSKRDAYRFMHEDLDRFFRIKSGYEKRLMDCLILKRLDSIDRLKTKSGDPYNKITKGRLEIRNRDLNTLFSFVNTADAPIMLDETGYQNYVDITIDVSDKFNLEYLNAQLQGYGLKLEPAKRMLPIIVIKQIGTE